MSPELSVAKWIIFHIPHNSTVVPEQIRHQYIVNDQELERELLLMTDHFTRDLFTSRLANPVTVESPVSRLVVDVERFDNDSHEPMAAIGMGAVYTNTHKLTDLRRPLNARERETLITQWYRPHHEKLETTVSQILSKHQRCLVIDCHSYPKTALPYEINSQGARPEVCIGTDDFHSPEALASYFESRISQHGYSVARNTPFSGSLVPLRFYKKDARVLSIMLEVRRDTYMDECSGQRNTHFDKIASCIQSCIAEIAAIDGLCRGGFAKGNIFDNK